MKLTRRAFNRGGAAIVAAALLPVHARATVPPRDEALVLARATDVDLSAQETAVVFTPVPVPRRPPQKSKPGKGEKPAASRTWIVLRDVVAAGRTPVYDLFLVLEGPDVFRPTTTSQPVGVLELGSDDKRSDAIAFDVSEPLAKLSKVRGYRLQYLRLTIVRRPATDAAEKADAADKETVPSAPTPPEIGAIELVRW